MANTYGGCGNISCQNHIVVWCSRMCRTTQATGLTQHQRSALWNFQIGSTLSPSIRRPAGHSPAHSQSSLPSHATNGHQFYPSLGQGPGDSMGARPQGWIASYRVALSLGGLVSVAHRGNMEACHRTAQGCDQCMRWSTMLAYRDTSRT